MFTLILLFSFVQPATDGGAALNSQQITGFQSEASCKEEARKSVVDLTHVPDNPYQWKVTVKASCLKIK